MKSTLIYITILSLFNLELLSQINQNNPPRNSSISINIGKLREWRSLEITSCEPNNDGISNSISYRRFLNNHWFITATLHLDLVDEKVLNEKHLNSAYQLSVGRTLYKGSINSLHLETGPALLQDYIITYQCLDLGNGLRPENISDKYKYTDFYSFLSLEFEHHLTTKWSVGLNLSNYFDFLGYGRTDFTGVIRYTLR
ncbi:hypothetical protein [Roseivirga sp.]|uniref:hypothetical protein n=1 Tax=Roseivirga sp. TaxID=1964215 RepID=UPI003B52DF22